MGTWKLKRNARIMGTLRCTSGLTVDAGGVTVTAGGVTLTTGELTQSLGNVAITAGGVDLPVETSTGSLTNYGLSVVTSTKDGTFDLAAPTAGVEKFVSAAGAVSTYFTVLRASTAGAVTFDSTNHLATWTSSGTDGKSIHLIGASSVAWAIMGTRGTVAFSTA